MLRKWVNICINCSNFHLESIKQQHSPLIESNGIRITCLSNQIKQCYFCLLLNLFVCLFIVIYSLPRHRFLSVFFSFSKYNGRKKLFVIIYNKFYCSRFLLDYYTTIILNFFYLPKQQHTFSSIRSTLQVWETLGAFDILKWPTYTNLIFFFVKYKLISNAL